jgi:hypothetical protein
MLTVLTMLLQPVITTQPLLLDTLSTWPRRSGVSAVGSATGWQPMVLQINGTSSRSTSLITMMSWVMVGEGREERGQEVVSSGVDVVLVDAGAKAASRQQHVQHRQQQQQRQQQHHQHQHR